MGSKYIVYKTNKVVRKVSFDEILYIESIGRKIKLETESGSLMYYEKLADIVGTFDDRFCRAMSSCYVNMSNIKFMSGGIVNFSCGKTLVLCRDSFLRVKREFHKYLLR